MKRIIFDTDPGVDDAIAILALLAAPELEVLALTTVAGNVNIDLTTKNAQDLIGFLGVDIPVAKGAHKPLLRPYEDASYAHGKSGMGAYHFKNKPAPLYTENAQTLMVRLLKESQEPVTLACVGPLTNIALLLHSYPELKDKIDEIVVMGGTYGSLGNTHSLAEYNFFGDPHAAKMVLASGVPVTLFGLNVTHTTKLHPQDIGTLSHYGEVGQLVRDALSIYQGGDQKAGYHMHDACVTMYLLQPELFTFERHAVSVVTEGPAMGALIEDLLEQHPTNAKIAIAADAEAFSEALVARLIAAEKLRQQNNR